jgi:hypothetical protein
MRAANILHLGVKELRSLARDPMMLVLIVFAFTFAIYASSTAMPETLNKASIHCGRGPLTTLDAHRPRLLSTLFCAAGDDHPCGDGCPHGRGA